MKKLHNFDEVFDGQKVFRKLLEAMSNPGRWVSIAAQSEKMYGENKDFLAIAMTLIDNEMSFNTCDNTKLEKDISLLTLSGKEELAEADFIFVESEEMLKAVFSKAKCGTLEDPQKSATILIKINTDKKEKISLYGAGIDEIIDIEAPNVVNRALELRKEQGYEYPQGIDMIFINENSELLAIPRLVMKKEEA